MGTWKRKVTPDLLAELRRLRKDGWSYSRLAVRLDVSPGTVAQQCRKMGLGGVAVPRKRRKGAAVGRRRPGGDGWRCGRVTTSERIAIRAEHAAGATVAALARKFVRDGKTIERVVGLIPAEDRTHLPYLFDLKAERTEFDRAVDRGLCALTPGYRRVVDVAEAEYARRAGR